MSIKRVKSVICIAVCMALMLAAVNINAAWDGYKETEDGSATKLLVDTESINNIFAAGALPSTKNVKNGRYSSRWNNHPQTKILKFTDVERDWSDCDSVTFDIYSEKATNSNIVFMVYCDYVPTPGKTISYQLYRFKLDWTGWKTFNVPYTEFLTGNYADWAKVIRIEFIANGWDCTPNAESDLYITSVYGNIGEGAEEGEAVSSMNLTVKQKRDVYDALGASAAVMNFGGNIISGSETITLEQNESITTAGGVTVAPTQVFDKFFGTVTEISGQNVKISLGEKTLETAVGSREYTAGGEQKEFTAEVYEESGQIFLPLAECAAALGKYAETREMVTVIGAKEEAEALFGDKTLMQNVKIMLNVRQMKAEDITKEDWRTLKDKWRKYLIGDENKDTQDEYIKKRLNSISASCKSAWDSMNKEAGAEILFGRNPITESSHMTNQFTTFYRLVEGYGTYGSEYYKNNALRRDILYAFEWLYNNLYGQAEIEGRGWRDTSLYNWWDWYCGSAKPLVNALLIMEDDLTPKKIKKYLSLYNHLRGTMRTGKTPDNAASRVYAGTAAAALEEDFERMNELVDDYNLMMKPVESGNGMQEDDLYITHKYFAYSTAYGTSSLLDRLVAVEAILAGTAFEFATPYKYNPCNWLYETFDPLIFNGGMTNAQSGRSKGSEQSYTSYAIIAMLDLIGAFGKDDDYRLKQAIKRSVTEDNKNTIYNSLNADQTVKLTQVLEDETVERIPYYKNKIYYTGDSVMHHRDKFGFALSMSSSRIAGWESINGVNLKGWYQGDGMLYMYVDGDPNAYDANYWKTANPYHMPGTTVDTQERAAVSIANSAQVLTNQDFVGAVGIGGEYATAAMQLESFHNDVEGVTSTKGSGGAAPLHNSTLMAKKSWFMFDDELVALGADINADDGFDVHTVVENRKLNKTENLPTAAQVSELKEYSVVSIKSSGDDGNVAENTIDGDYGTRWSQEGDAYVIYELEHEVPVGYVGIAQYNGTDGKQAIFDLQVSSDGENWTTVWSGKASGTTVSMEAYDMKNTNAKYVRYMGHGRTNSMWNSVTELKIYPPSADGSMKVEGEVDLSSSKIMGSEIITVDGEVLEKKSIYTKDFQNPKWMHIEGIAGYVFPQGGALRLDKKVNTSAYIEAWLDHGVSPKKGTYSYILLPMKTAEQTMAYSENPDIEIISNTEKLQAVREKNLGITGMVFWESGALGDITASEPMMIMERAEGETREISISDPTKLLSGAAVTLKGNYEAEQCDERLKIANENGNTVITVDFAGSKGRSLTVKLKNK